MPRLTLDRKSHLQEAIFALARSDENSGRSGSRTALEAVAATYEAGEHISFAELFAGEERRRIAIPSYPFQRRRFWVQPRKETA